VKKLLQNELNSGQHPTTFVTFNNV